MKHCRFFLQGRCMRGDSCMFRHDIPATSNSSMLPEVMCVSAEKDNRQCAPPNVKNTAYGFADNQNNLRPDGELALSVSMRPSGDSRSSITCKYHLKGNCKNGHSCPYGHSKDTEKGGVSQGVTDLVHEQTQKYASRELAGAFVQFEDGGRISKISLASDFSAIRLNGLSPDSTRASVAALLEEFGFRVPTGSVQILRVTDPATSSADVNVEDSSFAKKFCAKFKSSKMTNARYSSLEALPVSRFSFNNPTSRRVSCRKVHISWHKPARRVWLNFGDRNLAREVSEKFNSGIFRVCNMSVTASLPRSTSSRGRHRNNPVPWTVTLSNVPYYATEQDVQSATYGRHKPRHVEMGRSDNPDDPDVAPVFVKSLLIGFGPVEFAMATKPQGKYFKGVAHFQEESDARQAVQSLRDKSQEFLNGERLTLQLVCSAKFRILTSVYDSLEEQVSLSSREWEEQHLRFRVYRNTDLLQRFTVLRIEGDQAKEVSSAANRLEEVLAGKIVEDSANTVWHPELATNGALYQKLKEIQQEYGVVLIRDKAKRQLKFFGPLNKYKQIQRTLIELLRVKPANIHTITLEPDRFIWACHGGFKKIAATLGDDVVSLDVVSNPKKVVITGTQEQYQTALHIVQGKKQEVLLPDSSSKDQDCSICWTAAENPVLTTCNHLYCLECFEGLCNSTGTDKDFTISCAGEMARCGKILSLQELQDHVSSTAFEAILEKSFSSYIQRHPQDFRYCPTPDCGNIYRTSATAASRTCTKCLEIICTACHQQHSNTMTCAEYKDLVSGGYHAFEKYKKEKGVKDCPTCSTPMEKTEGCNHMTCGGCGAHICWVCLRTFIEGRLCYEHMNAVHGGIGLDHLLL